MPDIEHVVAKPTCTNHCCPQLGKLYGALAKAQLIMPAAKKDSKNPFFHSSYADFASIVEASREALSTNGLCVLQRLYEHNGKLLLLTRLCHESGQHIEGDICVAPKKDDVQALGSHVTYLKRYCYAAIVGVVTTDDDDGEKAMARQTSGDDVISFHEMEKVRP